MGSVFRQPKVPPPPPPHPKDDEFVQVYNPRSKRWVKINKTTGRIVGTKTTEGPYKGIRKAEKK